MVRGSLWAAIARRSSAAAYSRWRGGEAAPGGGSPPALVDAHGPLAQPSLTEQLAVSMADRLPGWVVAAMGVPGMRGLAWIVAAPLRVVGGVVGLVAVRPMSPGGRR